jgi:hypothetical protein
LGKFNFKDHIALDYEKSPFHPFIDGVLIYGSGPGGPGEPGHV